MSLESFYGGKQGVSPVVKARFKYVDTNDPAYINQKKNGQVPDESEVMELCFSNTAYDTVWYGQLAIIDTTNKRNKNNGKLFRRVLGRSNDETKKDGGTPHAEYIGRIVGPSEGFPKVQFSGSIEKLKEQIKEVYDKNGGTDNDFTFPIGEKAISNDVQNKDSFDNIYEFTAAVDNNQLVPGVKNLIEDEENGKWEIPETVEPEKGIHYSWTNIRRNIDGETEDTYVYLGFEIPFTIFDFDFKGIDWDDNFKFDWLNKDKYLEGKEPFYQHWQIKIPRGITGNHSGHLRRAKFEEFKNLDPSSSDKDVLYKFEDVFSKSNGSFIIPNYETDNNPYPYIDKNPKSSILVYTFFINRKNSQTGKKEVIPITCYIGDINDIEEIKLQNNGEIFVKYSDGKAAVSINNENKIKWINSISYNADGNNHYRVAIKYNTNENDIEYFYVPYIKDLTIRTIGDAYQFYYTQIQADKTGTPLSSPIVDIKNQPFTFSFIDDFKVNNETKELTYRKRPGEDEEYQQFSPNVYLNSIEDVYLGKNGHLFVKYSSSAKRYDGNGINNSDSTWIPYPLYWHVDSNNRTWYRGGDLPGAKGNPEIDIWWEDLGLILQNKIGGLIREEFNKNRYIAYAKVANLPEKEIPDWDSIESNQLLKILRASWMINGAEYNPYIDGHIYEYSQPALGEKTIEEWITEGHTYQEFLNSPKVNGVDGMGQLIYFRDGLYFFDNVESRWKFAGSWSSTDAINKMQIVVQTNNDITKILPRDRTIDEYGFSFLNNELPTEWNNEMPNLFSVVGD